MKNLDKLPVLIIVVGFIAAIFFFYSDGEIEKEISDAENLKAISDKQLEIYRSIDNRYGSASSEFYSNKPIVVLRGKGATEVIRIYFEQKDEGHLTAHADWDNSFDGDWGTVDGKWSPISLTSKISQGVREVSFTNTVNDESFDILVIIK